MGNLDIRDIGALEGARAPSIPVNTFRRTQVYQATHDEADNRLPLMKRSFISFTYGGKNIEDFAFVSVVSGDRMQRSIYADFSDNTTNYDVIDGQFYWGSHFTTNRLSLTLATDEMLESELLEFKRYFVPGPPKELILAEAPNRGIMARIAKTPEYHMLPFEKQVKKKLGGRERIVSTTVYRGDISLEFVMDDPFWYSIKNVLPSSLRNVKGEWVNALDDPDSLKVVLEDEVPTLDMIDRQATILTGQENSSSNMRVRVMYINDAAANEQIRQSGQNAVAGGYDGNNVYHDGSRLYRASISIVSDGANSSTAYIYYAGTAPAPTILTFTITPQLGQNGALLYPMNSICKQDVNDKDYNYISVGTQVFKFSTPSLLTGYNQAYQIFNEVKPGTSTIDLRITLNDRVNEYYSRAWALGVLNYMKALGIGVDIKTSQVTDKFNAIAKHYLKKFLVLNEGTEQEGVSPVIFTFNSKTGVAKGTFTVRQFIPNLDEVWISIEKALEKTNEIEIRFASDNGDINEEHSPIGDEYTYSDREFIVEGVTDDKVKPITDETYQRWLLNDNVILRIGDVYVRPFKDYIETVGPFQENVGDMVYDKYLYLKDRNYINEEGMVTAADCQQVFTDYPTGLQNFELNYKHMYL